jgi:hypothetical protein
MRERQRCSAGFNVFSRGAFVLPLPGPHPTTFSRLLAYPFRSIGTTGELPEVFSCPGGAVKV